MQKSSEKHEQGYILLLAILMTSIFLSISLGIYSISIKEIILASFLRDSQKALAAADRGSECALYWDNIYRTTAINKTIFANNSVFTQSPIAATTASCSGIAIMTDTTAAWTVTTTANSGDTRFTLPFSNGSCANVRVYKTTVPTNRVTITSDGLSDCNAANLRRTQRTIEVNFGF